MTETLEEKRLSRFRADVLLLVDLVAADSDAVALTPMDSLEARFAEKAADAEAPTEASLRAELAKSTDEFFRQKLEAAPNLPVPIREKGKKEEALPPTTRSQRKILTRRELLRSLLDGRLDETVAKAEAAEPSADEKREITTEYFNAVLDAALSGDFGLARLTSWDRKEFVHYKPLLSQSYARLLSAENNPLEQVRETVRENARIYPRPTPLASFEDIPFNFKPETIQEILDALSADPESSDIRFTQSSLGTVFLYSTQYLDDAYADFLAEHLDVTVGENP